MNNITEMNQMIQMIQMNNITEMNQMNQMIQVVSPSLLDSLLNFLPKSKIELLKEGFVRAYFTSIKSYHSVINHSVVGSTAILGSGEDYDILVLLSKNDNCITDTINQLIDKGWNLGGSAQGSSEGEFYSLKNQGINLILTQDAEFFGAWNAAVQICTAIHHGLLPSDMTVKGNRILVHKIAMNEAVLFD